MSCQEVQKVKYQEVKSQDVQEMLGVQPGRKKAQALVSGAWAVKFEQERGLLGLQKTSFLGGSYSAMCVLDR